ncbi:MAG: flagellar export chaperone FliS [Acidobacteriia bacterium]|nr:flagellar export chaperone FliS [Terriglobia bacterium]
MAYTNSYLEHEVLGATRVELVKILYRSAIEAIAHARRHLKNGEIRERSRQISKAWDILAELNRSLDHMQAGELARSLCELYVYLQNRLLEANAAQSDEPLAEAELLLNTLAEAWNQLPDIDCTY